MRKIWRTALVLLTVVMIRGAAKAQWQNGSGGWQYLINPTEGVRVGTTATTPPSALTVDGNEMGAPTGEVFRTDAPNGSTTTWRLLRGGTERGRLFSLNTNFNFNMEATTGDMRFWTEGVQRARITRELTGQTINGYTGLDLSGHVGIGPFTDAEVNRPFTMLHIDNDGQQDTGYRPWQKAGVTITQGSDMVYMGMKDELNNVNHMTLCWADNTFPTDGPDMLKFIFLAKPIMASGIAGGLNGLEAVRIRPAAGGNETFFGIGDWFTTGGDVNPDERLDLLDRTIRMRRLLPDYQNDELEAVVVSDANGRLHWRDAATLGVAAPPAGA